MNTLNTCFSIFIESKHDIAIAFPWHITVSTTDRRNATVWKLSLI